MKKRQRFLVSVSERKEPPPVIDLPPVYLDGTYYVTKYNMITGEVTGKWELPNTIMNICLNLIGQGYSITDLFQTMSFRSDQDSGVEPDPTDYGLGIVWFYDVTTNNGGFADAVSQNTSPEYGVRQITRILTTPATTPGGSRTLSELGFTYEHPDDFSGQTISWMSRTIFRDPLGNPTPIVLRALEALHVIYELRIYAPLNDITGSLLLGPPTTASIDYTIRPQNVGLLEGWLSLLTDLGEWNPYMYAHETAQIVPRGGNNNPTPIDFQTSRSLATYVTNNFYRDITHYWTFTDGNFDTGIGLLTWNPWYQGSNNMIWQMHLSQSIVKVENNRLEVTFRQYWGRK